MKAVLVIGYKLSMNLKLLVFKRFGYMPIDTFIVLFIYYATSSKKYQFRLGAGGGVGDGRSSDYFHIYGYRNY